MSLDWFGGVDIANTPGNNDRARTLVEQYAAHVLTLEARIKELEDALKDDATEVAEDAYDSAGFRHPKRLAAARAVIHPETEPEPTDEELCARDGHPPYGEQETSEGLVKRCYCGAVAVGIENRYAMSEENVAPQQAYAVDWSDAAVVRGMYNHAQEECERLRELCSKIERGWERNQRELEARIAELEAAGKPLLAMLRSMPLEDNLVPAAYGVIQDFEAALSVGEPE